ncbi:MAG: tetratricopeptide repeat protein [Acidobacteriaceae bacterium]|nr:tetratricopeptide repeat protein [Acidobacteriaceae bacterium]
MDIQNTSLPLTTSNRNALIGLFVGVVVLLIVVASGYTIYQHRTSSAETAFGEAMQTYQTPLVQAGQPVPPGVKTFPDAKTRAAEAAKQFASVADQYGMTQPGRLARYFQGLTLIEQGQNASAETTLKDVAGSWNGNVSALAKLALAQLYQQTGRDPEAVTLYQELGKGKAATVPPGLAQIQLAALYESEGKSAEAKKIYAQVKDSDKDAKGNPGPAGQVATQKLAPQK